MYQLSFFMTNGEELLTKLMTEEEANKLVAILLKSKGILVDLSEYNNKQVKKWLVNLNNVNQIEVLEKSSLGFKDWRK